AGPDCPHPPSVEVPQPPPASVVPQPPPAVVVPQPPPAATPASIVVAAPTSSDVGIVFHLLAAASSGVRTSPHGPTAGPGLPQPVAVAVVFSPVSDSAVADFPLSSSYSIVAGPVPPVRLQLHEQFGQDLPVLCLCSNKGGEFSSNLLRDFCRGRAFSSLMEVARTSMIHAATPHFLWPFAGEQGDASAKVGAELHPLDYWVLDTGAAWTMTPRKELLDDVRAAPINEVCSASGHALKVAGAGRAAFKGADNKLVVLHDVLLVPDLKANLISLRKLAKAGVSTSTDGARTYKGQLGNRVLWDLHESKDVYRSMWQLPALAWHGGGQAGEGSASQGECNAVGGVGVKEIGQEQKVATPLFCDSKGALGMARNAVLHGLNKHMCIKWHWLLKEVKRGTVNPIYIKTHQQPADFLTKRLADEPHWRCVRMSGMSMN
ncbi:unnamed protein product, partial [Closterium sp. NIES-54]